MSDQNKLAEGNAGQKGDGQSGGGAYPNPHSGKDEDEMHGFEGHGGQSGMEYHGTGQLGEEKVGENANAPAKGTKPDPR
jgi:hypothetical protein